MTSSKKSVVLLICGVLAIGGWAFCPKWSADAAVRPLRPAAPKASDEKKEGKKKEEKKTETAEVGADLKALAKPKKAATTLTGFPAGTLPGEKASGESASGSGGDGAPASSQGRVVLSGEPMTPLIGASQLGLSLDRIFTIADHAGYSLVLRRRYVASALDAPYSYSLMKGRRRLATLFFDRSLKLSLIQ